ncbi:MAG: YolD-like family protein [Clostridia bacterium]|nr:YolD-like family protein [Clostridia bacterium]
MNREDRAKQFMPFDALKGLSDALKMKEYEHDRICKKDLSEEKIFNISNTLLNIKKNDLISVEYFCDGHYLNICGRCLVDIANKKIIVSQVQIDFDSIYDIKKID